MKNSLTHNLLITSVIVNIILLVATILLGDSAIKYERAAKVANKSTVNTASGSDVTRLKSVIELDEQILNKMNFLVLAERNSNPENCPEFNQANCVANNKAAAVERQVEVRELTERRNQLIAE